MTISHEEFLKLHERRKEAMRDYHPCTKCGSKQVQLVDYSAEGTRWKCRHCKHAWVWEVAK